MTLPQDLIDALQDNKVVVFAGSGTSIRFGFPNWTKLVTEILSAVQDEWPSSKHFTALLDEGEMTPIDVLKRLEEKNYKRRVLGTLSETFVLSKTVDYSFHKKLLSISDKVVTTNYDKAFEFASESQPNIILYDSEFKLANLSSSENYIFKIHGDIDSPDKCILFEGQYQKLYNGDNAFLNELKKLITDKTILFVGFSLTDPYVVNIFKAMTEMYGGYNRQHYVLTTDSSFSHNEIGKTVVPILLGAYTELDQTIDLLLSKKKADTSVPATPTISKEAPLGANTGHDIPQPKQYFSGRAEKLIELSKAFIENTFILIEGAGGIGKTQLVAKFIQNNNLQPFSIWFECTPTTQIDDVIIAAGFEDILKGGTKSEKEKLAAFKTKIEENNVSLFLDNYHEVQANETFHRFGIFIQQYLGKGHVVLIGRDNLVTPTFAPKRVHVSGLGNESLAHAQQLIKYNYQELTNIDPSILAEVCMKLKGHPLTVDLAIYLLSQNVPPQEILNEAAVEAEHFGDSEKISERLLNKIFTREDSTEEEKEFLRIFSIFRGKTDENEIKSIVPENIYKTAIKKLVSRNLLTVELNKLEVHPLIREICYAQLEDPTHWHYEAAKFYIPLRNTKIKPELEEKIFYHLSSAAKWSDILNTATEYGREFIAQGYLDRLEEMILVLRKQGIATDIFSIFEGDIAEIRGEWKVAAEIFKTAIRSSNEAVKIEGTIKYGEMLFRMGEIQEAQGIYENVIESSKHIEKFYARAINDLGLIFRVTGRFENSISLFLQALEIRRTLGNDHDVVLTLINIAGLYLEIDQYKEASLFATEALELSKLINNSWSMATSLLLIAHIKENVQGKNNYDDVFALYNKALQISQQAGNLNSIASIYVEMGHTHNLAGRYSESIKITNKGLDIYMKIGNVTGVAFSYAQLAISKENSNKPNSEIIGLLENALEIFQNVGNRLNIGIALNNLGSFYCRKKIDIDKGCLLLLRSLAIANEIKIQTSSYLKSLVDLKNEIGHASFKALVQTNYQKLDSNSKLQIELETIISEPKVADPKIGRNDPCPCGSGKKFKNCHGRQATKTE